MTGAVPGTGIHRKDFVAGQLDCPVGRFEATVDNSSAGKAMAARGTIFP